MKHAVILAIALSIISLCNKIGIENDKIVLKDLEIKMKGSHSNSIKTFTFNTRI